MPEFKYTAIDRSGQQAAGKVDADSADDARKKLMAKGLMVTALSGDGPAAAKPAAPAPSKGFRFGAKVTPEEVTTMARQLATLLTAGLPLLRALELIHKQERNPLFKEILGQIADNVSQGNNFSEALAAHPKAFDRLFVNMVKAG